MVPAYVQSFVVKPNEIDREAPFISHNIEWTRKGFGLDQIELREFQAEGTTEALDIDNNRENFENIRLWDWQALKDTLKQIQAIRTYYDFQDVDVDRYLTAGKLRQTMVAPRGDQRRETSRHLSQLDKRAPDLHSRLWRHDEQCQRLHARRIARVHFVEHAC